jgi:putative membrane protein
MLEFARNLAGRGLVRFAFAVLSLVGAASPTLADVGGEYPRHGPGMMWDYGWGGWMMGPGMMLIFLVLAVVLVVVLVRWLTGLGHGGPHTPHGGGSPSGGPSALEILEQRFARGEIDEDEFRKRKRALTE